MSYVAGGKEDKEGLETGFGAAKTHKIRITLTSTKLKPLEKVCTDLVNRAKDKDLRVKGPVRLPTKILSHTTRKTVSETSSYELCYSSNLNCMQPCGEGSKTWDRYTLKIHKRLIDLTSPAEVVKQIVGIYASFSLKIADPRARRPRCRLSQV